MDNEIVLELKNVTKFYNNEDKIFESMTISFPKKCIIGLIGENGSGKTTFIKMISGMTKHNSGDIYILNKRIEDEETIILMRDYISILGDANRALYWNLTGMDNIEYFWTLKTGSDSSQISKKIQLYIQKFKLAPFINNRVETYSKGMKQRLLLLISLLNSPSILFMDEPLNGLDYENAILFKKMINMFTQEFDGTIFITSHDRNFLNEVCDKQYEIKNKTIIEKRVKNDINRKFMFLIEANTEKSFNILFDRYLAKTTTVHKKVLRLCINVNNAEFFYDISQLIKSNDINIMEIKGL